MRTALWFILRGPLLPLWVAVLVLFIAVVVTGCDCDRLGASPDIEYEFRPDDPRWVYAPETDMLLKMNARGNVLEPGIPWDDPRNPWHGTERPTCYVPMPNPEAAL